jgi:hypothetical protein
MQLVPGGTVNLAVLGGNLPPSFGIADARSNRQVNLERSTNGGRGTRSNGPVARSTRTSIESFQLK